LLEGVGDLIERGGNLIKRGWGPNREGMEA
jgi:hypothetical protein